jgi:hypothetical protein
MRRVLSSAAAIAIVAALGGCGLLPYDPAENDPMAIREVHGDFVVTPCVSLVARSIEMDSFGPAPYHSLSVFFRAQGSIPIKAGQQISAGSAIPTLPGVSKHEEPYLVKGSSLSFTFEGKRGQPNLYNDLFVIGPKGVPAKGWLQPDGNITAKPCLGKGD